MGNAQISRELQTLALRQAVCGLENPYGDNPRKPRTTRYLEGFCVSGLSLTVAGRRVEGAGIAGFLYGDLASH